MCGAPRCEAQCTTRGGRCGFRGVWRGKDGALLCGSHSRAEAHQVECAICLSVSAPPSRRTTVRCGHVFCTACLRKWADRGNATCPMCRGPCLEAFRRASLAGSFAALFDAFSPLFVGMDTLTMRSFLVAAATSKKIGV